MAIPDYVKIRPEDKEALEALLAANPTLFEHPADTKAAELQAQIDQMLGDYNDWKKWHDETLPLAKAWETENVELKAKLAELQAAKGKGANMSAEQEAAAKEAAAKAAAAATGQKTAEEIFAERSAGFITKEQFEAAMADVQAKTLEAAGKTFWEKIYPEVSSTLLGINDAGSRFAREFPEETWDRAAFLKFAKDGKYGDVTKAYADYTSDRRKQAEIKAAVDKALTDERAKVSQEQIPGSAPRRAQDMGILEQRARNVTPAVKVPENTDLGRGSLAALAAEELRREGKSDLDTQRGLPA